MAVILCLVLLKAVREKKGRDLQHARSDADCIAADEIVQSCRGDFCSALRLDGYIRVEGMIKSSRFLQLLPQVWPIQAN
jgi:hypothetical protein